MTKVTQDGSVMTIEGSAQKCKKDGYDEAENFTLEVTLKADSAAPSIAVGNKISVSAYKFDKDKGTLTIKDVKDIVKK